MNLSTKFTQAYFELAYNPIYDFTTAQTTSYSKWQETCINKLLLADGDRILCVGAGTGNEILRILEKNHTVRIIAIDSSQRALRRAKKKAHRLGREIETRIMDAHALDFPSESFDAALCLHLMDFLHDGEKATREIVRVLRRGGHFAATYPMSASWQLGLNIFREGFSRNFASGKYHRALVELLAMIGAGIVYLPLTFRSKGGFHSCQSIEDMYKALNLTCFEVEEHNEYQDWIAYGSK